MNDHHEGHVSPTNQTFHDVAQITFPVDARAKYPQGFAMALANFGSPRYGGALMCVVAEIAGVGPALESGPLLVNLAHHLHTPVYFCGLPCGCPFDLELC